MARVEIKDNDPCSETLKAAPWFYSTVKSHNCFLWVNTHYKNWRQDNPDAFIPVISLVCKCKVLQARRKTNYSKHQCCYTPEQQFGCRTTDLIPELHLLNCSGENNLTASEFEPSRGETLFVSTRWQANMVAFANHPALSSLHVLSGFLSLFLFAVIGFSLLAVYTHFSGCLAVKWS